MSTRPLDKAPSGIALSPQTTLRLVHIIPYHLSVDDFDFNGEGILETFRRNFGLTSLGVWEVYIRGSS
jgi:hypothetical protein